MNMKFEQKDRMGRLQTVLGPDVLNLVRFTAEEHVNDLFTFQAEAVATKDDLDFDNLIGTRAQVILVSFDQPEVPFEGVVTEAELLGIHADGYRYRLTLRPWLWLLGLRRKQQIYHRMSVVQILQEVLAPHMSDVELRLNATYPELEYTVQYRESDLAFVCRMMERFGISYHFMHGKDGHKLVLTDATVAHDKVPGVKRPFRTVDKGHRAEQEHFWEMRPARRLTTGAIRLTDYNFKEPMSAMETDQTGDAAYEHGQIESYDYPGDYLERGRGKTVAKLRTDQERGQDQRHRAEGDCASLRAGHRVTPVGDKVPGVGEALVLSARHMFRAGSYHADGEAAQGEDTYEGAWLLMPVTTPLAPERKTPRAVVQGPQTAVVVGEGEIDCDEYGRILVRFHWDLDKRHSMRCRVSQNWASKGWGGMVIPRIGMEVVVEFLEGDPDKPLVTGCVYNGKNDVPYALPEHKTRSTFKTDTHQGEGFNELRFEDERDIEEIRVHAQRDYNEIVRNDRASLTLRNSQTSVRENQFNEVLGDDLQAIMGSKTLMVGGSNMSGLATDGIGVFANKISEAARKLTDNRMPGGGNGDFSLILDGSKSEVISRAHSVMAGGNMSYDTGGSLSQKVRKDQFLDVFGTAQQRYHRSLRMNVTNKIVMVCGRSRLELHSDGRIRMTGTDIEINGSDKVHILGGRIDMN